MGIAWARIRPINFLDPIDNQPSQRDFSAKKPLPSRRHRGDDMIDLSKPSPSFPSASRPIRLYDLLAKAAATAASKTDSRRRPVCDG